MTDKPINYQAIWEDVLSRAIKDYCWSFGEWRNRTSDADVKEFRKRVSARWFLFPESEEDEQMLPILLLLLSPRPVSMDSRARLDDLKRMLYRRLQAKLNDMNGLSLKELGL